MTIKLCVNNSEANKINKNVTVISERTGHLREGCSVTHPIITLEIGALSPADFNYLYIADFERYYFITDIKVVGKNFEISARCDVLYSFRADINRSRAVVERNSKNGIWNAFINDPDCIIEQDNYILFKKGNFTPFSFNSGSYIMAVAGGSSEE